MHFGAYEAVKEFTGGNERGIKWISTGGFPMPPEKKDCCFADGIALQPSPVHLRTVASDALMNPFDGEPRYPHPCRTATNQTSYLLTVIKQRMQVHKSKFRSVFTCARVVYQN
jgi:solute carrier family 25 iron transporter 28/37